MLSPNLSTLPLQSEDIREYEAVRKNWPQQPRDIPTQGGIFSQNMEIGKALHKEEVHQRIGFVSKPKK